jgi:hypothetical protein
MVARVALRVEECCSWCRRPVTQCATSSCDDAPTYSGILLRGQWESLDRSANPLGADGTFSAELVAR